MNIRNKENDNMSKMSELSQVLDDLICCGEQLIRTANAMKECFTEAAESTVKPKKEAKASEPEVRSYSKEEVRALLAAKAKEAGGQFKAQVKAIVKKYGNGETPESTGSLTDVPAESYPALVSEVEGLKDA
jgi:hypothetical protein